MRLGGLLERRSARNAKSFAGRFWLTGRFGWYGMLYWLAATRPSARDFIRKGPIMPDPNSLTSDGDVTRRSFTTATLATGFALAVQPISAQDVITTNTDGIEAGEVKIPVADGTIPAYRAMPSKGDKFPVVLVVQEIFGVHEHIKDLCRRLAKKGYLAVAPELSVTVRASVKVPAAA